MEAHDLVLAKLAAGRPNDITFAQHALRARLVGLATLVDRIGVLPAHIADAVRARLHQVL